MISRRKVSNNRLKLPDQVEINIAKGQAQLITACFNGDLQCVREIIEANGDVNIFEGVYTPLIAALEHCHQDVVQELIKAGACINQKTDLGYPLAIAISKGCTDIVSELLIAGANVKLGRPVEAAIWNDDPDILLELKEAGADMDEKNIATIEKIVCCMEETTDHLLNYKEVAKRYKMYEIVLNKATKDVLRRIQETLQRKRSTSGEEKFRKAIEYYKKNFQLHCKGRESKNCFHKPMKNSAYWSDLEVFFKRDFKRSIGLLEVKGHDRTSCSHGTCFRVGLQGYVMTAYHVVASTLESIIEQISARIISLEDDYKKCMEKIAKVLNVSFRDRITSDPNRCMDDILKSYLEDSGPEINFSKLLQKIKMTLSKDTFQRIVELLNTSYWKDACTAKFEGMDMIYHFDYDIPFGDEANDIIILKIRVENEVPPPVILNENAPPSNGCVFGYPGEKFLQMDAECPIYSHTEEIKKSIDKAVKWWTNQYATENRKFFEVGYRCGQNKVFLHTSENFTHGASGGPIASNDRMHDWPIVSMMYQAGYPTFYYEAERGSKFYKADPPPDVRLEAGISMQFVAKLLNEKGEKFRSLKKEIFDEVACCYFAN